MDRYRSRPTSGRRRPRAIGAAAILATLLGGCQDAAPPAPATPAAPSTNTGAPSAPGPLTLTEVRGQVTVDGALRTYRIFRPDHGRYPVIVALHGKPSSAAELERVTGLREWAARRGMAVAYPDGLRGAWGDSRRPTKLRPDPDADLSFLSALADALVDEHGADPDRTYLAGLSNGGTMALRAAAETPGRFRAVAAVAGQLPAEPAVPAVQRGLPTLLIYGTSDPLRPYTGLRTPPAEAAGFTEPPVATVGALETTQAFAAAARTGPPVRETLPDTDPGDGTRVECTTWPGRDGGPAVVLYTVRGGGHTWPGAAADPPRMLGPVSRDINASDIVTGFFAGLP